MKRFSVLALALVLVLGLGAVGLAGQDSDTIDVTAVVSPYAEVEAQKDLDFGTLSGEPGLYTVDSSWMRNYARNTFGGVFDTELPDQTNSGGWAQFEVETNTDVTVQLEFVPGEAWFTSPNFFSVINYGWEPDMHGGSATIADFGPDAPNPVASFTHYYNPADGLNEGNPNTYTINAAVLIETISQQAAGSYDGEIVVTVSY